MAYVTYTTKALVCGTFNRNTADASYLLFTREAGMLYADARSVRKETSKQRYSLQDFSLVRVSLIKGKIGWKIGSIEAQQNYYHQAVNKEARGSVVSLFRLLRRFVKGEESAPVLFDYVTAALTEMITDIGERSFLQLTAQVEILSLLGYVNKGAIPADLQDVRPEQIADHYTVETNRRIEKLYEQAIAVSHL